MKTKSLLSTSFIILLLVSGSFSFGQTSDKPAKHGPASGGIGFFTPGIHTIQYSKLNNFLPYGMYQEITNKPFVTGGAGYGIVSNIVIGGEGGNMHAGSFTKSYQVMDLSGDYGFFSLGYVVMNKKGFLVYPLLSIGNNTLQMYIHQKDMNPSFAGIVGEPIQAATLHYKSKMLKFSIAGTYAVQGSKSDQGTAGFLLGFQAGYQASYKPGVWTSDNGNVSDGPDFSHNGFFIQLMIGGGGVMRK